MKSDFQSPGFSVDKFPVEWACLIFSAAPASVFSQVKRLAVAVDAV